MNIYLIIHNLLVTYDRQAFLSIITVLYRIIYIKTTELWS